MSAEEGKGSSINATSLSNDVAQIFQEEWGIVPLELPSTGSALRGIVARGVFIPEIGERVRVGQVRVRELLELVDEDVRIDSGPYSEILNGKGSLPRDLERFIYAHKAVFALSEEETRAFVFAIAFDVVNSRMRGNVEDLSYVRNFLANSFGAEQSRSELQQNVETLNKWTMIGRVVGM